MSAEKIAFVASGGGMSGAYGAGAALALQEAGIKPDIFIGSSGGACTATYFACGQAETTLKLWGLIADPRVIQRRPFRLDIDVVVDTMRDRFPFDDARLRDPLVDLYVAATDYAEVRTRYFSNHEPFDWVEVIRASMAIPFVYGRKIMLDGRLYYDGDVVTSLETSIALAKNLGATKIYACDTRWPHSLWSSAQEVGFSQLCTPDILKTMQGEYRMRRTKPDLRDVDVVYIKRPPDLATNMLNNDLAAIKEAIDTGYADARKLLMDKAVTP